MSRTSLQLQCIHRTWASDGTGTRQIITEHLFHLETKAATRHRKKPVSCACSQGMTPCFPSASVAHRLPAMYFLRCSKIWKSLYPLQPTGSVTGYDAYGWDVVDHPSYSRDLAIPNNFHLFGPLSKHVAGKIFSRDADMKQTVTPRLDTWHRFLLRRYTSLENHDETSVYMLKVITWRQDMLHLMPQVSRIHKISQHQSTCCLINWNSSVKWLHSPAVLMKCKIPTEHVTRIT